MNRDTWRRAGLMARWWLSLSAVFLWRQTAQAANMTTDIAIELPHQGGGACSATGSKGAARLIDGVLQLDGKGPHTMIPPDFTAPLVLPFPLTDSASRPRGTKRNQQVADDVADWVNDFMLAREALSTSAEIFSAYKGTSNAPASHCTYVVEVTIPLTGYANSTQTIPSSQIGTPDACTVSGPPQPRNPTICIPLQIWSSDSSTWPALIQQRLDLYAQANEILAVAERLLDNQQSAGAPARQHRKKR